MYTTLYPYSSGGKNVEGIAKERNLAVSTIYAHLYYLIANDYLSSADVVSEEKIKLYSRTKVIIQ